MIKISNLIKTYGKVTAINDCSFTIKDHSVFGLVGVNGSGKSTLLRLLSGVFKQDAGSICYDNNEVYDNIDVKKELLFISDTPFAAHDENIDSIALFYSSFYRFDMEKYKRYLSYFEVNSKRSLSTFSKGMRRRVYLAVALTIAPKYLLLDEALDGLDPKGRLLFKRELLKIMDENDMTIIIASHSLRELEDLIDSYVVLSAGKVISSGDYNPETSLFNKYIIGFNEKIDVSVFNNKNIYKIYQKGKIVEIIAKGDVEEMYKYFNTFKPLLIENIKLSFEEQFLIESEIK